MAKRKRKPAEIEGYRHDATRKNNPLVGMVQYEVVYDPHLSPKLIWADKSGLRAVEVEDAAGVDVDTVSLHIHERINAQAIQRPQPKRLSLCRPRPAPGRGSAVLPARRGLGQPPRPGRQPAGSA
jgi:hypothetical protein